MLDNKRGFYLKRVTVFPLEGSIPAPVISPRDPRSTDRLIELTSFYNCSLEDPFVTKGTASRAAAMTAGIQALGGIDSDGRGVILLAGSSASRFPLAATSIPLNRKVESLHVLHGARFSGSNGLPVGAYVLHHASGATGSLPIT